jgi:hypothetical protein
MQDPRRGPLALAILGEHCLLVGSARVVEEMVSRRGQRPLAGRAALLQLVERLDGDPTFWLAADGSLLTQLNLRPGPGAPTVPLGLPSLRHVVASGTLEPQLALDVVAEVGDEAAARSLAEMVRGFVALLALQARQKPAFAGLMQAVALDVRGPAVRLGCRLSQEQAEALVAAASPASRPSPEPAAAAAPGSLSPASPTQP